VNRKTRRSPSGFSLSISRETSRRSFRIAASSGESVKARRVVGVAIGLYFFLREMLEVVEVMKVVEVVEVVEVVVRVKLVFTVEVRIKCESAFFTK